MLRECIDCKIKSMEKKHDLQLPNLYIKSFEYNIDKVWDYLDKVICDDIGMEFTPLSKTLKVENNVKHNKYLFVMRADDIQAIKSVVEQKCLVTKTHYIVLKIVEQMKHNTVVALSSLIKHYTNTTVFIIIENQYNLLPIQLQHLFLRVTLKGDAKTLTFPSKTVKKCLDNLLILYKKNTIQSITYFTELRKFCVKISAGCLPISKFAQYVLEWKADSDIVFFLSEMDVNLKQNSKEIFVLEYYVQSIINHCYKHDL